MDFWQLKFPKSLENKPILSVDYGTVAVGLALFCPKRDPYPFPIDKILYKCDDSLSKALMSKIREESIEIVVLGLPIYSDGTCGSMAQRIKKFGDILSKRLSQNTRLFYQNEALTTFEAKDRMKSSPRYNFKVDPKQIDSLAACIILEEFVVEKSANS